MAKGLFEVLMRTRKMVVEWPSNMQMRSREMGEVLLRRQASIFARVRWVRCWRGEDGRVAVQCADALKRDGGVLGDGMGFHICSSEMG